MNQLVKNRTKHSVMRKNS